jgi:hypothetical protein
MLGTMVEKATTMVAALQKINDEQQDCLYKFEVMAGIRSADAPSSPQSVIWLVQPPPPKAAGAAEVDEGHLLRDQAPTCATTCFSHCIYGPEIPPALPSSAPTSGKEAHSIAIAGSTPSLLSATDSSTASQPSSLSLCVAHGLHPGFFTYTRVLGTELSSRGRMTLGVGVIFWFISHTIPCQHKGLGLHIYSWPRQPSICQDASLRCCLSF